MRRTPRFAGIVAAAVLIATITYMGGGAAQGASESWIGVDGQAHETLTLPAVKGKPGSDELFASWDFDDACRAGDEFVSGLRTMAAIARVIRKSGRRVLWTVAPNKTSVMTEKLDMTTLPHGACALQGFADQESLLDNYPSRGYLPLRSKLAKSTKQTYWRSDTHWTSVGASVWVKSLARTLSPALAKRQKWYNTVASYWGILYQFTGVPTMEAAPAIRPRNFVSVTRTRGIEPGAALPSNEVMLTEPIADLAWRTKPARATWRGRTLLIGDSFTFTALELMRPLFNKGRFLWFKATPPETIAKAVVRSDTVVLELVQVGVAKWGGEAMPALLQAVRTALADAPRR